MSKIQEIQVGIIGVGMIGMEHIRGFRVIPRCRVAAIADLNEQQLAKASAEYAIPQAFTDYKELLALDGLDAVVICVPSFAHEEIAMAALAAGKHVLCEKPMTLDLDEASAIAETVRRTGKVFMIAHPTRYTPAFILARKIIARGDIGELFMAETEYAHNYRQIGGKNNWRKDHRRDPLLGGGCHAVDLLRWVVDEPLDEAFAYGTKKGLADWPIDFDSYFCLYKFKNGVIGKVMCSIGLSRPYTMRSVFYGTLGTIICDNLSGSIQLSSVPFYDSPKDYTEFVTIPVDVNSHNVESQVKLLADIVLRGAENTASVVDGARTVAACAAAIESAHTGKAVKVRNDF